MTQLQDKPQHEKTEVDIEETSRSVVHTTDVNSDHWHDPTRRSSELSAAPPKTPGNLPPTEADDGVLASQISSPQESSVIPPEDTSPKPEFPGTSEAEDSHDAMSPPVRDENITECQMDPPETATEPSEEPGEVPHPAYEEVGSTGEFVMNPSAAQAFPYNIIVFGAAGAGKSSIINMIAKKDVAKTSSGATGCTFKSESHQVEIEGLKFTLWDTSGLNEGDKGRVPAKEAVKNLQSLARSLNEGVSLLIYCVRGPRIQADIADNYNLFYRGLCQEKVPIILVVTGLEGETSLSEWWQENESTYGKQGMAFNGHACAVATRGKERDGVCIYEEEYAESQSRLRELVCAMGQTSAPWDIEVNGWLGALTNVVCRVLGVRPATFAHTVRPLKGSRARGDSYSSQSRAELSSTERDARVCYRESKFANIGRILFKWWNDNMRSGDADDNWKNHLQPLDLDSDD